jgi:hypothetical protein
MDIDGAGFDENPGKRIFDFGKRMHLTAKRPLSKTKRVH